MIHQVNDLLLSTLGDAPDVPRVLVGCMKDLAGQRQVTQAVSFPAVSPIISTTLKVLFNCFESDGMIKTKGSSKLGGFLERSLRRMFK